MATPMRVHAVCLCMCLLWLLSGRHVMAVGYQSLPKTVPIESSKTQHTDASSSSSSNSSSSSSSSNATRDAIVYACDCLETRKVSLMGASDYCLSPAVSIVNKCGNVDLAEKGECPRTGSQPCQPNTGHVLTKNAYCALDGRDNTYKCVASKDDLKLHQAGKVGTQRIALTKTNSPDGSHTGPNDATNAARASDASGILVILTWTLATLLMSLRQQL